MPHMDTFLKKQDCKAYSPKLAAAFKVLVKSKGFLIGVSSKSMSFLANYWPFLAQFGPLMSLLWAHMTTVHTPILQKSVPDTLAGKKRH